MLEVQEKNFTRQKPATTYPKVTVITINYNGDSDTIAFIESLNSAGYPNIALIIVDNSDKQENGSLVLEYLKNAESSLYITDENSVEQSRIAHSDITFISATNRGFAAANNVALRCVIEKESGDDYVLIINNDVVIDNGAINKMVDKYEKEDDNNVGIVAPVIYYYDTDLIWSAGGRLFTPLGLAYFPGKNKKHLEKEPRDLNFLSGCAWLIRIDRLRQIGLMDETFFMYGEDVDYSLRVIEKKLKLITEPGAIIRHKIGASSNGQNSDFSAYWMMFGRIRVVLKHNNFFGSLLAVSIIIISRLIVFPSFLFTNRSRLIKSQTRAIVDGLTNR